MPNLPGNPYAAHSGVSDSACENDGDWGIAQAAMALAYEQRTANLIAYLDHARRCGASADEMAETRHTVYARLGDSADAN